MKFKISVVLVGKSLKITIPKEVAEHLKIKKGDTVDLWVDNNRMIVEKKQYPRAREHDTIEDLDRDGMLSDEGWKFPRKRRAGKKSKKKA